MRMCRNLDRRECGGELCALRGEPCKLYQPARAYKAFGWDVTVRFGAPLYKEQTFHWRGCSETAARRKGMLKPHAEEIVHVVPIGEGEWVRAYGDPRLKNES